jgi:hypothetical protein
MLFQSPPYNTLPVFMRVTGNVTSLAECAMDKAVTAATSSRLTSAFLEGAVARVQVMQYGDLPTVSRAYVTRCLFAIAPPPAVQRVRLPCHAVHPARADEGCLLEQAATPNFIT